MSRNAIRTVMKSEYARFIKEWKRIKKIKLDSGVDVSKLRKPTMHEWRQDQMRRNPTTDLIYDEKAYFPLINEGKDPWGAEIDTAGQTANDQDGESSD